jgi:hypothetical protein
MKLIEGTMDLIMRTTSWNFVLLKVGNWIYRFFIVMIDSQMTLLEFNSFIEFQVSIYQCLNGLFCRIVYQVNDAD